MHHLQRIHDLHHHQYHCILYITYIFKPIQPYITYNIIFIVYNIDNITYISYRWSTSRELLQNLKNVIYTGVDLQVIHFYLNSYKTPACKVICTEIVTQGLLHRSSASRWSNCIWTPAESDFSSSSISLWRQGQPGGGLRNVTLCGVPDTQTCGEMRVLFVLGQPSAEMVRVGWANMWCGEMRNFFARSNRLRRSCVSNAQACGGMWISLGHGQPSAEIAQVGHPNMRQNASLVGPGAALRTKWGSTVKNWCKIVILKVQMQAWRESQTAITAGKLKFFNVRCKRSRNGVKLRLYPFWNVRHNRFARNKTCVKLRFYKVRRNPFTQNDCPTSKIAIFHRRMQPFRTIWWPNIKNLRKTAIFWSV